MECLARLNDNLFTTLQGSCVFECGLGWVHLEFVGERLAWLSLENTPRNGFRRGGEIRACFLEWLRAWDALSASEQWARLDLGGTAFQRSVWRALLDIAYGERSSYGAIAAVVERPKAFRAVGSAVGANPVSVLVPCHRVLPSTGRSGNYRWGAERKRALLDVEQESGSDLSSLFR